MTEKSETRTDRLVGALDSLRIGIAYFNSLDQLEFCNEQFRYFFPSIQQIGEINGCSYESLLRRLVEAREVVDDAALHDPDGWIAERLAFHKAPFSNRIDRLHDNRWIDIRERRTKDGGSIVILSDATERVHFDLQLREASKCIGDGFGIVDHEDRIIVHNQQFLENLNVRQGRAEGIRFSDALKSLGNSGLLNLEQDADEWYENLIAGIRSPESETTFDFKDGRFLTLRTRRAEDGSIVIVMNDVTKLKMSEISLFYRGQALEKTIYELEMQTASLEEQGKTLVALAEGLEETKEALEKSERELEEAKNELDARVEERTRELQEEIEHHRATFASLREAKRAAEEANRAKTAFLANTSHELRTPLNAIIGMSDLLLSNAFGPIGSEKNEEYVRDINKAGNHLLAIIADLLDVARIESGEIDVESEDLKLSDAVHTSMEYFAKTIEDKNAQIYLDVGEDYRVRFDRAHLVQVLTNILSNALKYSGEAVRISVYAREATPGVIDLVISDNGYGIDEKMLPRVTDKFFRADQSQLFAIQGTGLGLTIVKELLAANHASFEIDSVFGDGTTVSLHLPKSP